MSEQVAQCLDCQMMMMMMMMTTMITSTSTFMMHIRSCMQQQKGPIKRMMQTEVPGIVSTNSESLQYRQIH
jgi:predicted metal-binding protein